MSTIPHTPSCPPFHSLFMSTIPLTLHVHHSTHSSCPPFHSLIMSTIPLTHVHHSTHTFMSTIPHTLISTIPHTLISTIPHTLISTIPHTSMSVSLTPPCPPFLTPPCPLSHRPPCPCPTHPSMSVSGTPSCPPSHTPLHIHRSTHTSMSTIPNTFISTIPHTPPCPCPTPIHVRCFTDLLLVPVPVAGYVYTGQADGWVVEVTPSGAIRKIRRLSTNSCGEYISACLSTSTTVSTCPSGFICRSVRAFLSLSVCQYGPRCLFSFCLSVNTCQSVFICLPVRICLFLCQYLSVFICTPCLHLCVYNTLSVSVYYYYITSCVCPFVISPDMTLCG